MARFVFAMNMSLDGYVDHDRFEPDPTLFRHFIAQVGGAAGSLYGRRLYETMRYWDEEDPAWSEDERAFAAAWCAQPKWVVSRTLRDVGPNATLVGPDLRQAAARLKREHEGDIEVGGPQLAAALGGLGLLDEYRLYVHPVVLGGGKPLFARARPPLRLAAVDRIGEDVVRLTYRPA